MGLLNAGRYPSNVRLRGKDSPSPIRMETAFTLESILARRGECQ